MKGTLFAVFKQGRYLYFIEFKNNFIGENLRIELASL